VWPPPSLDAAYSQVLFLYGCLGVVLGLLYACLSSRVEAPPPPPPAGELAAAPAPATAASVTSPASAGKVKPLDSIAAFVPLRGLEQQTTKAAVLRLMLLFGLDAFAGGLVIQSYLAWWFHVRWHVPHDELGRVFFCVNIASGVSGLLAGYFVKKMGAIRTMVFTQIPSNVLMFLVPLMPSPAWGIFMLVMRYSISQMDVPARQAYVAAIVAPHERSAAGGWTNTARSIFVAGAPFLLTLMGSETATPGSFAFNAPFFICAILKTAYDALVYFTFDGGRTEASSSSGSPAGVPAAHETSRLVGATTEAGPARSYGAAGRTESV